MTIRRFITALAASVLLLGATQAMPATATPESFEVVFGQMVFANQAQANQAESAITSFLNRARFRDEVAQILQVPAGKYGAGPTLVVTIRSTSRADADAIWAAGESRFGTLQSGSQLIQSSVTFDSELGTQTVTVIHKRSFPAAPGDVQ